MSEVAIPASVFEPARLLSTLKPASDKTSRIMLQQVVFPFVPVTVIMVLGLSILPRKSGQSFIASLPGK